VRAQLAVREELVRTRTRYISAVRAVLRRDGVRVQALALSAPQQRLVATLLALLRSLNQQLAILEAQLARGVAVHAAARRLCTVQGVGPATEAAAVATLDEVGRFASAGKVAAYVGLVPRERSLSASALPRRPRPSGPHGRDRPPPAGLHWSRGRRRGS
jgi:transposase